MTRTYLTEPDLNSRVTPDLKETYSEITLGGYERGMYVFVVGLSRVFSTKLREYFNQKLRVELGHKWSLETWKPWACRSLHSGAFAVD